MKTIKTLLLIVLTVVTVQYGKAQNGMKDPVSFKLKNGLTVIVAENETASKVFSNFSISSYIPATGDKPGVQVLLTEMLNESASKTDAGITFDEKGANVAVLSADFGKALNILSALVQKPVLGQVSFDEQKVKLLASIEAKNRYYADDITVDAVEDLKMRDVLDFYRTNVKPATAFLTIAGNITISDAKALVRKAFGEWEEVPFAAGSK